MLSATARGGVALDSGAEVVEVTARAGSVSVSGAQSAFLAAALSTAVLSEGALSLSSNGAAGLTAVTSAPGAPLTSSVLGPGADVAVRATQGALSL